MRDDANPSQLSFPKFGNLPLPAPPADRDETLKSLAPADVETEGSLPGPHWDADGRAAAVAAEFRAMLRKFMACVLVAAAASFALAAPPRTANPILTHCLVSIKDEVQVPAEEPGVLVALDVREGMQVTKGQRIGLVDDSERQVEKRLALIEQKAAQEQAANDIKVRHAEAVSKVAEAEYEQAVEANNKVRGTFPVTELRRLKLAWQRAYLEIEQAAIEQKLAGHTVDARGAEVEAADMNIARRTIESPLDGEVVSVLKHNGEWTQPGEPVLRIVRFDTLRIEGFLNSSQYDPSEVSGRPVKVQVALARGRTAEFQGTIVYVSPLVQAGGEYRVWAEVANRQENNHWLLRPGLIAEMTIELK